MIEHTTRGFDADLNELASKVREMGRLGEKQIKDAAEALDKRDGALARLVIAADDQVDALQREVEEKAVATIAAGSRSRWTSGKSSEPCEFQTILSASVISQRISRNASCY